MQGSSLLGAALLSGLAHGLAFPSPHATIRPRIPTDAQSPRPTQPPLFDLIRNRAGSDSSSMTFYVAPDNTCGYVSGSSEQAYTCNAGSTGTCIFVTPSAGLPGGVGCCNGAGCGLRFACYDLADIQSSSCDRSCMSDTLTLKCSASSARFCGAIVFGPSITDFFCASTQFTSPLQAVTTYSGETGRTLSPLVVSDTASASLTFGSQTSGSSQTTPTTSTGSSPGGQEKKTNVGAIAGGVVGGVAGLALIGAAIFFLVRHNKKKSPQQPQVLSSSTNPQGNAPPGQPSPMQQQQQQHQPFYGAGGHDPSKLGAAAVAVSPNPSSPGNHNSVSGTMMPVSPSSVSQGGQGWGQQPTNAQGGLPPGYAGVQQAPPMSPAAVHEAGGSQVGQAGYGDHHRGELHELQ